MSYKSVGIHEIHLIPHGLTNRAVYKQLQKTMSTLTEALEYLCDRVDTRIQENVDRLEYFHSRIEYANTEVEKLSDRMQLPCISIPHTPISIRPYRSILFSPLEAEYPSTTKNNNVQDSGCLSRSIPNASLPENYPSQEQLTCNHIDSFCATLLHPCDSYLDTTKTGPFPFECLSSATSLLVFNTNHNPYRTDTQLSETSSKVNITYQPEFSEETNESAFITLEKDDRLPKSPTYNQAPICDPLDLHPGSPITPDVDQSLELSPAMNLCTKTSFDPSEIDENNIVQPVAERLNAKTDRINTEPKQGDTSPLMPAKSISESKTPLSIGHRTFSRELLSAIHTGKTLRSIPKGRSRASGAGEGVGDDEYNDPSLKHRAASSNSMMSMLLSSLALRRKAISVQDEEKTLNVAGQSDNNKNSNEYDLEWKS